MGSTLRKQRSLTCHDANNLEYSPSVLPSLWRFGELDRTGVYPPSNLWDAAQAPGGALASARGTSQRRLKRKDSALLPASKSSL